MSERHQKLFNLISTTLISKYQRNHVSLKSTNSQLIYEYFRPVVLFHCILALVEVWDLHALLPAAINGKLIQTLIKGREISLLVHVQLPHLELVKDPVTSDLCGLWERKNCSVNLFCRQTTAQSHIAHPALCDHHALRPTEASECRVRRQVGFTHVACATNVGNVVGVIHVEQCPLQDLWIETQC